jgi:hypothetical protein
MKLFILSPKIILAQEWKPDIEDWDDLAELIKAAYELEYKYSMVKNGNFKGVEKRKQNILNLMAEMMSKVLAPIREQIIYVYENWLSEHAILNPEEWAKKRVEDFSGIRQKDLISSIKWEFNKINSKYNEQKIEKDISNIVKKLPCAKNFINSLDIHDLREEIFSNGYEWGQDQFGVEFQDDDEFSEYLDNLGQEELYERSYFYATIDGEMGFEEQYHLLGNTSEFIKEIYQYYVFPIWMKHWGAKGIARTRERIEKIYENLKNLSIAPQNIGEANSTINIAINAAHQTGSMAHDYMDVPSSLLQALTDGTYIEEWNKDLIALGVKI